MRIVTIFRTAVILNAIGLVFTIWRFGLFNACTISISINLIFLTVLFSAMKKFMKEVLSVTGKYSPDLDNETAIKTHLQSAAEVMNGIQSIVSGIDKIGSEHFEDVMKNIRNESVTARLIETHNKIIEWRKNESQNNWITSGLASIAGLKHKGNDIGDYSLEVISMIVKYMNAQQGSFFIYRDEGEGSFLELSACYAYGKKKHLEKRISPGEGLAGQVLLEKEMIYLREVPKDYIKITSGLGEALPRCVCIVPLLSEAKIQGVIEIASFNELGPPEIEYLKKISESIAYNLSTISSQRHTEYLLEASQKMSQEVKSQEEELRQNMEELEATQEQMRRKQTEMDAVLSSLSTVELDLNSSVIQANEIFLGITGYTLSDIQGKRYKSLIPQHGNDPIQYEIMWNNILSGRSFSGEFRIVNKDQREMWMAGNFTPILDANGQPYKVMVISLFTTQDKEKLLELQELVAAFKSCFPIAEINPDLTFRSASDLFLGAIGVKRLDLKKFSPKNVLINGSLKRLETCLLEEQSQPDHVVLDIQNKDGVTRKFNSTLIKIGNVHNKLKRGLVILHNAL